jgi:GDP/UDP-N,N'-diacetylbacillosamine 2-epimerase (hydrolysing)
VQMSPPTGATMARAIGAMMSEFVTVMEREQPDIVLLLGDRGEMLAGATAALHLNIPVAHIHGGERSGTVDESIRHAVSKLSHIHFTATDAARARLIALGETHANVHVTGAPGLDGLTDTHHSPRADVLQRFGLDPARPAALVLFHPVLQEAHDAATKTRALFQGLAQAGWQSIALMPNADAGSDTIRAVFETEAPADMVTRVHLPRAEFITCMAAVDAMIGNSSSGIIEAASFGTPVINLGSRQNLRERNENVTDMVEDAVKIATELRRIAAAPRPVAQNIYGDGQARFRIAELLKTHPLGADLMNKVLAY